MARPSIQALIGGLNPMQRLGLSTIQRLSNEGLSANAIQRQIIGTPFGIGRSNLLRIVAYYKDREQRSDRYSTARPATMPDLDNVALAPGFQRRKLNYIVRLQGTNPFTGESQETFVTIASNRTLRFQTAIDKAIEVVDAQQDNYKIAVDRGFVDDITLRSLGDT